MARIALGVLLLGLLALLWAGGFFQWVQDVERVRAVMGELGPWAPVLYVLAFSLLEPLFVPAITFIIPGAVVFPYWQLLMLSWLGATGAGVVGFVFARTLGREFVEQRLPPSLRVYDERLARDGLRTVIFVRLTFFLAPPAHWLLGLSRVDFGSFVLGTAIGFVPGIVVLTYVVAFVGGTVLDWLASQPRSVWVGLGAGLALLWLAARLLRMRRARERAPTPDGRGGDRKLGED